MRFVTALICTVVTTFVVADDRFYTTVDAQGHVQVIKSDQPAVVDVPKQPLPLKENSVPKPVDEQKTSETSSVKSGTRQVGTDTYIDAELLEKKNFNLQDKKRFYFLPNSGFGTQVVESKDGVISTPVVTPATVKPMAYVSSNSLLLSKEDIQSWYPQQKECISQKDIKKQSKVFKEINNIWAKSPLIPNTFEVDGFLRLSSSIPMVKQLRVVSFASTHKKPAFYVPVVVFLDEAGCSLSGVWQYWSRARSATETQYASVDGLINIPAQSAFVLFYRPIKTLKADIPLSSESGSLVVEAY